nr:immunoglobulin light chain junction region [Macaca mulatta]MOW42042.1 immunoglobulin light chain junction region [Macaca mulatta]MOW43006.1 immunoglobulin light chain junction region [Macaca mulatta]MOW43053.1 immunoglobulin light chain junction region [Macaca mulatta]MOW43465.1 immunoglobulin light chain junction region [Macaca mulatta]
CQHYKNFPFTF